MPAGLLRDSGVGPPPMDGRDRTTWYMFVRAAPYDDPGQKRWLTSDPYRGTASFHQRYIQSKLFSPVYVGHDDDNLYYVAFARSREAENIPRWIDVTQLLRDPTTVGFCYAFLYPQLLFVVGAQNARSFHEVRQSFLDQQAPHHPALTRSIHVGDA